MSNSQRDQNLHKDHRDRLRKTALQAGLSSLEDHNLLELLLFNAIPRRDTNETAHRILNRCGGIGGILNADSGDIMVCENAGENTDLFLNVLGAACERYMGERSGSETGFRTVNEARDFLCERVQDRTRYVMAVLTLDGMRRINTLNVHERDGATDSELILSAVKDALTEYSVYAFVAFTHPNGILAPDRHEKELIGSLRDSLLSIAVKLTDVLIITPTGLRCLSDTDILPRDFFSGQSRP